MNWLVQSLVLIIFARIRQITMASWQQARRMMNLLVFLWSMLNWVDVVYDLFKIINLTSTYCYFFWATIHRSKCATIYPFPTLFYMSLVIFILSCYVFFRIHKGFDLTCMYAHINQNCLPRMCSFHFLIWTSYIVHIQKLINWIFKKIHCLRWPSIQSDWQKCVCKLKC